LYEGEGHTEPDQVLRDVGRFAHVADLLAMTAAAG
jgi:hypothetical protein